VCGSGWESSRARWASTLSVQVALGAITATARRGGERATLVNEIEPPGINAWRLGALARFVTERKWMVEGPARR
jgi:hypothetical protein